MDEAAELQFADPPAASHEARRPRPPRTLTVAVTGATGFVGRHVCEQLTEADHHVRALVRSPRRAGVLPKTAERVEGEIFTPEALDELLRGAEACIHLIGVIEEHPKRGVTFERMHVEATRRIVEACARNGVGRYLHMSALGSRPKAIARYHQTKFEAERIVRASDLDWTIFRPSLIHGPDGEFSIMVAKWVRGSAPPFFFLPYFGSGPVGFGRKYEVQPVYVEDVAEAFVRAMTNDRAIGEVYPLGGPDRVTWPEMLLRYRDTILGPKAWRRPFPMPAWKAKFIATMAEMVGLGGLAPFNVDQVLMSQEDSVCDTARVEAHLELRLTPFDEALEEYAAALAARRPF